MMLDELVSYLEDADLDLEFGENLFAAFLGDEPDDAVALFPTPGQGITETFKGVVYDSHGLQVRVRAGDREYPDAHNLAMDVDRALRSITDKTVDGAYYLRVSKTNGPALMSYDDENRPTVVSNYLVWRADE